jgi:superoxide dismutase, Fe-Mn family
MKYEARTFNLPELAGLSKKQIEVHLGLYQGYVKHVNLLMDTVAAYAKTDDEGGKYAVREMRRRLGFEFDGMRLHEYYFEQFEGSPSAFGAAGKLAAAATEKYGSAEGLEAYIRDVVGTRGIGWVIVYFDPIGNTLHTAFVNDHELGQLASLPIILALDLWEHAYMVDYVPAEKNSYVDAFFKNLNWSVVEKRFEKIQA